MCSGKLRSFSNTGLGKATLGLYSNKLFGAGADGQLNPEQQAAKAETDAAQAAGLALTNQRRRRRLGSLVVGRGAIGSPAGGAPSGGGGSILGGGRGGPASVLSIGAPSFNGRF